MTALPLGGLARFLMGLALALLALVLVLAAACLVVVAAATVVRTVVPDPAVLTDPGPAPEALVATFRWARSLSPADPGGLRVPNAIERETIAAREDNWPLSDFGQRCVDGEGRALVSENTPPGVLAVVGDLERLGLALWRGRIEAADRSERSYQTLHVLTWAGIVIGLLTTIMVGLRGSKIAEEGQPWARTIAVLAITFPAVGTAVAGVAAFYAPREELARSSQLLAGLRQVHLQIAADVRTIDCSERAKVPALLSARFLEWDRRVRDLRAVALAATGAPQERQLTAPPGGAAGSPSAGGQRPEGPGDTPGAPPRNN